jgi:SAM-dependent methyltransferase
MPLGQVGRMRRDAVRDHARLHVVAIRQAQIDLLGPIKGAAIVDVGSGPGIYARDLALRGARVTAVDSAPAMRAGAVAEAQAAGVTIDVADGEANALPFPDATFDAATLVQVINTGAGFTYVRTAGTWAIRGAGAVTGDAWAPAAVANSRPVGVEEIRPQSGLAEKLLTFELPGGSRLCAWPERPLPEVVCSLQARPGEGLVLLWHSRLERNFESDPPRETVVTPWVTGLAYDYYDAETRRWTTETFLKTTPGGQTLAPQRLRVRFAYGTMTRESLVGLPVPVEGLPLF